MRVSILTCATALAAGACSRVDTKTFPQQTVTKRTPRASKLDVLFVIDNSPSTSDKQVLFAQNFPQLVAKLDAFPTGRPDLHIAIVTTTVDVGVQGFGPGCPSPAPNDDGLMVNTGRVQASCPSITGRFLLDSPAAGGGRTTNYTGDLQQAFSCVAQVGASGCGFEAPLEAMKRALDGSRPENAGFLRDDADLAIVILTDEDDCSVADSSLFSLPAGEVGPGDFRCQPLNAYDCDPAIDATAGGTYSNCTVRRKGYLQDPQAYVAFLATIKDPSQTFVGLIAGDPTSAIATGMISSPFSQSLALLPSCQATINGNPEIGRPAIRLDDFRSAYGDRGVFQTVCQSDYSSALSAFGNDMFTMMSPCLDGNLAVVDVDPANAGLQLDCTVTDRDITNTIVGPPFPPCQMDADNTPSSTGPQPCYWLESAAPACGGTSLDLELHVASVVPVDPSVTFTQATCAAAP